MIIDIASGGGVVDDEAECVAIIKQVQVMKSKVCILLGSLLKF